MIEEEFIFLDSSQTTYTGKDLFNLAEKSYDHASPWSAETFQKDIQQPFVHYYLATDAKELIGFIGYRQLFEEVEITNIVVAQERKGNGFGQLFLKKWLVHLKETKAEVVHLEVRKSNKVAIHVYKKMGFQLVNIRQDYYDYPVEDAIVMNLMLRNNK